MRKSCQSNPGVPAAKLDPELSPVHATYKCDAAETGESGTLHESRKKPAACTYKLSYEQFGKSSAYADRVSSRMIKVSEGNVVRPGRQQILDRAQQTVQLQSSLGTRGRPAAAWQREIELFKVQPAQQRHRAFDGIKIVGRMTRQFPGEGKQVRHLETQCPGIGLIQHQNIQYRQRLQRREVAGAVSHGTVGDFQ